MFGKQVFLISCSKLAIPAAGRYTLAVDERTSLGIPLFNAGEWESGFIAAPFRTCDWVPGTELLLYGPLGRGFSMPEHGERLAVISLGEAFCFLLPLVSAWLKAGKLATLFSESRYPDLPADLEAAPLTDLPGILNWADSIVAALPADRQGDLARLASDPEIGLYFLSGQVLVLTAMPCAGFGECGVCALPLRRSKKGTLSNQSGHTWALACVDGPVFDLAAIMTEFK